MRYTVWLILENIKHKIILLVYSVPRNQIEQIVSAHETCCALLILQGHLPLQGGYWEYKSIFLVQRN